MNKFGIGTIGCGGFGLFSLEQFASLPNVRLVALSEPNPDAARRAIQRFNLPKAESIDDLCSRPEVDIVYLATPPFLHHQHAMKALRAGKHVLCEKPLAITQSEADEMLTAAEERGLFLVANLLQRYNPLADAVGQIIASNSLGQLLHGYFENYASDESLGPDHWFWDKSKSGGIFVEHGVHFFDLFESWLGRGDVLAAQSCARDKSSNKGTIPSRKIEDQVQCCVRYQGSVLVNFYHGFHQAGRMDRQELRLVFERGELTLRGWIPTLLEITAIVSDESLGDFADIIPDARIKVIERYEGANRHCLGRQHSLEVDAKVRITMGSETDKMNRYGELVGALLLDQLAWIADNNHQRRITGRNGYESLRLALAAKELAQERSTRLPASVS